MSQPSCVQTIQPPHANVFRCACRLYCYTFCFRMTHLDSALSYTCMRVCIAYIYVSKHAAPKSRVRVPARDGHTTRVLIPCGRVYAHAQTIASGDRLMRSLEKCAFEGGLPLCHVALGYRSVRRFSWRLLSPRDI
jgi:hypothetical protein